MITEFIIIRDVPSAYRYRYHFSWGRGRAQAKHYAEHRIEAALESARAHADTNCPVYAVRADDIDETPIE